MMSKYNQAVNRYITHDTSAVSSAEKRIRNFATLARGWSYGEGVPFSDRVISAAIAFNREAIKRDILTTDAFPGFDGEIMVTVYHQDHYLEFIFENDGSVTFCHEKDEQDLAYQQGLSLKEALDLLMQFRGRAWTLYVSSTPSSTGIPESIDSTDSCSEAQAMAQASPWSTSNAYLRRVGLFATTSDTIIA